MNKIDDVFLDQFENQFGPVARGLGRLIRPTITAPKGHVFTWGDWSAIEARVLPFLSGSAGGQKVLDIFSANDKNPDAPDIYMMEAGNIYDKNPDKVDKQERQTGKVATLALGFGGADGALVAMATGYGIHLGANMRKHIVDTWRSNNKWARNFWGWWDHETQEGGGLWGAFNQCMLYPGQPFQVGEIVYQFEPGYLNGTVFCALPDGRLLSYPDVRVRELEYELENGDKEKRRGLSYKRGYGYSGLWYGKLAENTTQGYAASKLRRLLVALQPYEKLMPVVGHTHDEVLTMPAERDADEAKQVLTELMTVNEAYDERLPLAAEVTSNWYYTKAM